MPDYIKWIRSKVGNEMVILNFANACILNEKNEILIQRRKQENAWGLPGGAMELGESVEEALRREIKEETGLEITIEKLLGVYTKYFHTYPNGDKTQSIVMTFICRPAGGELQPDNAETLELAYIVPESMPPLIFDDNRDAIPDYIKGNFGVVR
jgi:mutator protein MutT